MSEHYLDQLARIRSRMGREDAERTATPKQNQDKRLFGRVFQSDHTSLRLAQRGLVIDREAVRRRLVDITGDRAVLFYRETRTFVPMVRRKRRNRADDWFCITVYDVRDETEAERKAARDGSQLIAV